MLRRLLPLLLLALVSPRTDAADVCPLARAQTSAPDAATRIVAFACEEHQLWHRPFIDAEGRLAGSVVREAETALLTNGEQAWRRVAGYWRDSGLLGRAAGRPGASECAYAAMGGSPSPGCRAFIIDTPWSAAFVSWVLRRAGLHGFNGSPSHVAYVRDAYRNPDSSAYLLTDPHAARPAAGDLLCYVRSSVRTYGFAGLANLLAESDDALGMHCDIVVAVNPGGDGLAYLVGGNVFDGVTMRMLRLTSGGQFDRLPTRSIGEPACSPDMPDACNASRQDWAVLLQLKPPQALARLAPPAPIQAPGTFPPRQPARPTCCIYCVAGDTSIPRCPKGVRPEDHR